ncbi:hypothetical protein PVAND_004919 [Polypedilum vanderplanki]|uniref:Uncharacterized protein n=1 Tax=Polypedilum vanderplanki TaxID=319348 RepID=A0A9J6BZ68_POLVA|nr:hypothetical protein PVAND_004919 [Polypedilum vanderplanki]
MKRKSNATEKNLCSTSPELQLEVVDENLTRTTNTDPVPSSSSSIAHEHKETYVNVMYNNNTGVISPVGTVESPIEDDDDAEMMKNRTKKLSRTPFKFKQFSLMKSGSFKLKQMSPQPTELASSPIEEKTATFERQKSTSSSTRSSRLKKLFMLSRADPSKRGQKDISLRNLRHVL